MRRFEHYQIYISRDEINRVMSEVAVHGSLFGCPRTVTTGWTDEGGGVARQHISWKCDNGDQCPQKASGDDE